MNKVTTAKVARLWENGLNVTQIIKRLKVARSTIYNHLREARYHLSRSIPEEEGRKIISDYQNGKSIDRIAWEWGRSYHTIRDYLATNQIPIRNCWERNRKYTINHYAFDNAETNPKASYWVGFMMSDGTILDGHSGACQVRLALASKDKEHLEKFRKFIGSDSPLRLEERSSEQLEQYTGYSGNKTHYQRVILTVDSNRLALALARFGVLPRKSGNAEVRLLEHNRDFWRGCTDGDGTIHIRKDGLPMIRLVGSMQLIEQFILFIEFCIQKRPSLIPCGNIWQASVHGNDAVRLINKLYQDNAVALDRKMELAYKAMQWIEKGHPRGETHHNTNLSDSQVREIKERLKKHHWTKYIAWDYGVSQKTIENIKNGKVWTHV